MFNSNSPPRYVIISPVKDEERYVEATLRSVMAQTVKPHKWVLVDDGSTDATPDILGRYAQACDWIQVLRLQNNLSREPGTPVMNAFTSGFELVQAESADFVVKLDCDVELPTNYFEYLLQRFRLEPALGIASGVYLEKTPAGWETISMPEYHAAGACKMMRASCFKQIGGFVRAPGWDTVDEIKAQALGWATQHFPEIKFYHLKKEGSGIGEIATSAMHGRVYYLTGGGKLFFLLKVLHRMALQRPYLFSGMALLLGYVKAMFSGEQRLVTRTEARSYARRLNRRIWQSWSVFRGASPRQQTWSAD